MAAYLIFRLLPDGRAEWPRQPISRQNTAEREDNLQTGDLATLASQSRGKRILLAYPGEQVHCLSLQAPRRRRGAWLQALPYALEDQVAQDLDALHFAVGKLSATQILPVAVVQRATLRQTLTELALHGLSPAAIVPDFLLLPYQAGQWTVFQEGKRALIRSATDTGFACEADNLSIWLAKALASLPPAEQPRSLRVLGQDASWNEQWPELAGLAIKTEPFVPLLQLAGPDISTSLNLRQGEFARQSAVKQHWRHWRTAAVLAGLGVLANGTRDAWEWRQLDTEQARLRTQIEQTFRQVLPNARLVNPQAQLETYLRQSQASGADPGTGFLPLLGLAASTLRDYPALQLRGLSYRQNRLEFDLRGGSLEQLDTLKARLGNRTDITAEINASVREGQVLSRLSLRFAHGDS